MLCSIKPPRLQSQPGLHVYANIYNSLAIVIYVYWQHVMPKQGLTFSYCNTIGRKEIRAGGFTNIYMVQVINSDVFAPMWHICIKKAHGTSYSLMSLGPHSQMEIKLICISYRPMGLCPLTCRIPMPFSHARHKMQQKSCGTVALKPGRSEGVTNS